MLAIPLLAAWACLFLAVVLIVFARKPQKNLPPGPRQLPLVGNMFDMPPKNGRNWEHFTKQHELFGPITSLSAFGTTVILLHDRNLAEELLGKRAAVTSDRPRPFFVTEMCGQGSGIAFVAYDKQLRAMRKHMYGMLGTSQSLSKLATVQDVEVRRLLLRILRTPDAFLHHIKSQSAGIMLETIYGYTTNRDGTDKFIDIVEKAIFDMLRASQPGAWLVDVIPALRFLPDWFPGTYFKQVAKEIRTTEAEFARRPWAFVKQQIRHGTHRSSFASNILEHGSGLRSDDEHIAQYAANGLYAGGADTTVAAIMAFFFAMMQYPDVQSRAQAEVDAVVGQDRLPMLEDREALPYVEAVVSEVLRWHTVVPEGVPHSSTEDCDFRGYFVPKGSILVPNLWLFGHDPQTYHAPHVFNPERFLGDAPELDPRTYIFGFGRRICPGRLLAESSMFLTIARVLAVYDISKPLDWNGRDIEQVITAEPGFVSHPTHFEARIVPRSEQHKALVLEVEKTHPFGTGSEEDMDKVTVW